MAPTEPSAFGILLRQYRVEAGLTQEELAERANLSARVISDLERGVSQTPRFHTVRQLADALQLSPEDRNRFTSSASRETSPEPPSALLEAEEPSPPAGGAPGTGVRTFLIVDVRGWTRFTVERGDEAAARLATKFAALAREIVGARDGAVIELRGDEALAVFTSARQALRAAIELQERFQAETEAEPDLPLPVGIGLDAGEAIPVEGGYSGAALNLVARLCSLAGPGEVLASEVVTHLARKVEGLAYVERGPVELKGFVEPVRVSQVVPEAQQLTSPTAGHGGTGLQEARPGVRGEQHEAPLPIGAFVGSLPSGPIVARDEELTAIMAAVDAVADGTGQLVFLAGQAGVGKTRLAQEATLQVRDRGFLIATGRCYEAERPVPFFPFREALAIAYAAASSNIRFQVPRTWPQLGQLLPELITAPTPDPSADPQEEQQRLIQAITAFLSAIAQERPVALLLDDLHLADEASLRLLAHLARQTRGRPVLILGTYRDTELGRDLPLDRTLRELGREHLAERVAVRRLTPEGTAAMVDATVGDLEMSEEFIAFVHRRTKGIPFFVEELLRSLGGHYRLVREIGAGGMGRVFQAVDTRSGKAVAAKIMFASKEASPDAALRFEQEGAVLAELQHPNIVEVYGTFMQEHASCIIMELLEGCSLAEILRHPEGTRRLDLTRTRHIARQVAAALGAAHRRGIVHRDIKPDNVMVVGEDRVKVTDFGIARVLRPEATIHTMTSTGMTLGTPLYMAPEQIEGKKVDGRADVYALGAVLYQMVTGRPPFEAADALTIAFRHINEAPAAPGKVRRGIPEDWEALILKALAKDPADRFQSAAQMEAAIAGLNTDVVKLASAASPAGDAAPTPRRSLLRVLTPPPRPGLGQARTRISAGPGTSSHPRKRDRATGSALAAAREGLGEARAEVEQAREERSGELSAVALPRGWAGLWRWLVANPLALGGGVAAVLVLVLIFAVVHPFRSSGGASGNLRPVAVWPAQAPGPFKNPDGVTVDGQGNIYVADQLANRIQKLSPTGQLLGEYGRSGSGPGQFSGPAGVAVDSGGNIYVADSGNSRIQKLSPTGQPLKKWGKAGSGPGQFSSPFGIALDRQGNIYVADAGNARIQVLSPTGQVLHQWRSQGSGLFQYPAGVAVDNKGNVYVSDGQSDRIEMLSSSGRPLRHWGRQGAGAGAFSDPVGLAVDGKGNVYVADQTNDTVQKFSSNGGFEAIWGTKGSAPGRFQSPQALAVDRRGRIVVADSGNHRVQQLSSAGKPLATWTQTGTGLLFNQPTGIALDADGNVYEADGAVDGRLYKVTFSGVPAPGWTTRSGSSGYQYSSVAVGAQGTVYVADQLNSAVLVLSSAGRRLSTWSGPASRPFNAPQGLAFGQGSVYVADTANDRIVKLSATGRTLKELGTPGAAEGDFAAPAGVAVDSSGTVYAVDNHNNNVQKISPRGQFIGQWADSGSGNGQLSSPSAVAVDAHGHVYVADTGNNRVEEFSSDGGFIRVWGAKGSLPGQFQSSGGIAVDSQGNVYVADTGNNRIQKFAPPG